MSAAPTLINIAISKDVQDKLNVVFVVRVTKMLGNVGNDQEHTSSVSVGNGGMNLLYRIFSIKRRTPNKRWVYRAEFKINAPAFIRGPGVYSRQVY